MKTLAIDIETYSSAPLPKTGVYKYVESPDFEILLFGYAWDDEPVTVIDLTVEKALPPEIISALNDPDVLKTAFNASFERVCLSASLNMELPPEQWACTAVMARELGLPNSLGAVGVVVNLPEDQQKLKEGKALIRYFSMPCKPTIVNGQRTRNLPEHDPERWQKYIDYNKQDVETERAIRKKLQRFPIHEMEHKLWVHDQHINDRGVGVDIAFVKQAIDIGTAVKDDLFGQAQELTKLENPKSAAQVKGWIKDITGVQVDSLKKERISAVRDEVDNEDVCEMLDLRAGLSRTSTEKYNAMLRTVCADERIRGLSLFYGASRTGRWAGRLVQLQNLPQNKMPDLEMVRKLVSRGEIETFGDVTDVLVQLIRTALIPAPGHRFIVADFNAIEAVVLAWLAGEKWRMDVFNSHGKIYEASAEQMFHLEPGSVKKGDPMRQKGKIAELALGYGGSVGALINMGALNYGLTEPELKPLVIAWRAANRKITKFWWDVDAAARKVIIDRAPVELQYGIRFRKQGSLMRLRLPSGRELSYVKPAIEDNGITYEGTDQKTGRWERVKSYGPKLVENIVQATARDCLAEAITRLEERGFPVVFHVHDEVICEIPSGRSSAKEISNIISEPIAWAEGLPLKADAYECDYYKKD